MDGAIFWPALRVLMGPMRIGKPAEACLRTKFILTVWLAEYDIPAG